MGHIHLAVLPRSKKWQDVVAILESDADDYAVIAETARAAERDLEKAASDPVYVEAVRLLLMIPTAARAENFAQALRDADVSIDESPDLLSLVTATAERLDDVAGRSRDHADFGELSARALVASLSDLIGSDLPGLFDPTASDVQAAARKLSRPKGISHLTRTFFGNLVSETLAYWLDRRLALDIGVQRRFRSVDTRTEFDVALEQFTAETTRIVQEFSAGWYGKTLHDKGRIDTQDAKAFGAVALKKIVSELRMKREPDA